MTIPSLNITSENVQNFFGEIAKSITSSLDISKIVTTVMKEIDLYFQPSFFSLFRLDQETQELYFMVTKGINFEEVKEIRLQLGEGIAGHVAQTGKSLIITNAQQDKRFCSKVDMVSKLKTKSLIAVPIIFQNKVLGVIELINTLEDRGFSLSELALLETIADFAAIAITNAMAYERIVWYSQHDPLTGLYNRSHLDQLIQQCDVTINPQSTQILNLYAVVVLIDVDKFKKINDTYGHQIGDQILIKIGEILNICCRENGFAYRIGGDEFLMTILDLNEKDLPSVIQRIQNNLQSSARQITPAQGFSFGIAAGLKCELKKMIREADIEMYLNKMTTKKNEVTSSTSIV